MPSLLMTVEQDGYDNGQLLVCYGEQVDGNPLAHMKHWAKNLMVPGSTENNYVPTLEQIVTEARAHCEKEHPEASPLFAAYDAEVATAERAEFADFFEHWGETVGAPAFTQEQVVRVLRGPKPFGRAAKE